MVDVEKFGSLRVHCKRVPAGRTVSRALAPRLNVTTIRPSTLTARAARTRIDFILTSVAHPKFLAGSGARPRLWVQKSNHRSNGESIRKFAIVMKAARGGSLPGVVENHH